MNNNCTKCGNPLQPGTTICPVCGTNNINAASQVAPVQATPVAPVQPAAPDAPVAPVQPVAPAAPVAPAQPVTPVQPVAPEAPAQPTAPVAQPVPATPAPGVTAPKEKKGPNTKVVIIIAVVAALIIIGAVVAMLVLNNSSNAAQPPTNNNNNNNTAIAPQRTSLNGYTFTVPTGWSIDTTSAATALVDKDVSTIVQLVSESGNIQSLTKEKIQEYYINYGYVDIQITEKKYGGRDAILVSASHPSAEYNCEFYYIQEDTMIIGAVVVYTEEDSKAKNAAVVETIMNGLKYNTAVNMATEVSIFNEQINRYMDANSYGKEDADNNPANPEEQPSEEPVEEQKNDEGGRF